MNLLPPLISALARWKGRAQVQQQLSERGFLVPSCYQSIAVDTCELLDPATLERYWDEWALEFICSAGRAKPNLRKFLGEHSYRSKYLDELATSFEYGKSPLRNPPIHPCAHEFDLRISNDQMFRLNIANQLELEKVREARTMGVSPEGWTGRKKDVRVRIESFLGQRGFSKLGHMMTRRCDKTGLIFQCRADTGGHPRVVNLPLTFYIAHISDPDFSLGITNFDQIVPGFYYYSIFESPEAAVLGIKAHAEVFAILIESLSGTD